jgi:hypothetical protein
MPRDMRAHENHKAARAKRSSALARLELDWKTVPRKPAASPTAMAVKAEDPEVRRLIDEALARRRG